MHKASPEYYSIISICPHTGDATQVGIFEDMRAVGYRLQRMYTSCGDEYRIECFHLSDAESEAKKWSETNMKRKVYEREEEMKEARLKEWEEYKQKEEDQMTEDCKNNQPDED